MSNTKILRRKRWHFTPIRNSQWKQLLKNWAFRIALLEKRLERKVSSFGDRVSASLDELDRIGHSIAMGANRVVWTAVLSALAGVGSIVSATLSADIELVLALGLVSIASALLATRER